MIVERNALRRLDRESEVRISRINPTADLAIAKADGDLPAASDPSDIPPPDQEWVPQLYQRHGLQKVADITGLSLERVRAILEAQGVPLRSRGRPRTQKSA